MTSPHDDDRFDDPQYHRTDPSQADDFSVVGCTHCDFLWILPDKDQLNTTSCPQCQTRYDPAKLHPLSHTSRSERDDRTYESLEQAADARARILAAQSGDTERYANNGPYAQQANEANQRLEAKQQAWATEADRQVTSSDTDLADILVDEASERLNQPLDAQLADHLVDDNCGHENEHPEAHLANFLIPDDYGYANDHPDAIIADAQIEDYDGIFHEFGPEGPDSEPTTPTLGVRKQARVTATPVDFTDLTPSQAWRALLDQDQITDALTEAVRDLLAGEPRQRHGRVLRAHGLEAGRGLLAERVANIVLQPDHDAHTAALDTLRNLDNTLGLEATSDLFTALSHADVNAPIDVHLDRDWFNHRAEQRRDVVRLLVKLSKLFHVDIIATGLVQHRLHAEHYADLTPGVRESLDRHRSSIGPDASSSETVQQRLEEAYDRLNPDGPVAGTLRRLARSDTGIMSYEELRAADVSSTEESDPVRTRLHKLAQLGLVERWGPQNDKRAEITPLGSRYLEETTHQSTLADSVFWPPKSIDNSRGSRASTRETPKPADTATADPDRRDVPADESSAASPAITPKRYRMGDRIAGIRYWNRQQEAVYRQLTPERGIALHDTHLDKQDDRREPSWGYDIDDDHLVVGAEYDNPMQYAVSIARALASRRTWNRVLSPSRVDSDVGNLTELAVSENHLLRDLCDVGWLDRYDGPIDYTDLRDAYADARADLMDLTTELASLTNAEGGVLDGVDEDDYLELRSEITRHALGLTGSMLMLLWLAGVDVSRVVMVPEYNRNFTGDDHLDRRVSLAKHLGIQAAICSQHHGQPLYRQLYEQRESKQIRAIDPRPEIGNPHGHQLGQVLVVGPSVDSLEDLLEDHVKNPLDTRDDAPEIGAPIPIRTEVPRTSYAELVNWRLRDKGGLRPSRQAVNFLRAILPDPRDGIEALRWLSSELTSRGVRLDELRYGISQALEVGAIDDDRLLPHVKPSERAIVRTLLAAERPIPGTEVHQRADITSQSWRNNREALADLNLIVETEQGWRLSIPFSADETEQVLREIDQRNIYTAADDPDSLVNVAAPWYLLTEYVVASDLIENVIFERLPPEAWKDSDHPVASVFYEPPIRPWDRVWNRYPALEPWFRVARALTAAPDPQERTITIGVIAPQARLSDYATDQRLLSGTLGGVSGD